MKPTRYSFALRAFAASAFALGALVLGTSDLAGTIQADQGNTSQANMSRFGPTKDKIHSALRVDALEKIQALQGSERIAVLVRIAGPRLDLMALGDARQTLREEPDLNSDLQARSAGAHPGLSAAAELETRAVERDFELRQLVETLDGEVARSFWLVNGFAAKVPAERLPDLAAHSDVLYLEPDGVGAADQAAGAGCSPSGAPQSIPWPGGWWSIGTYSHGGEEEIQQAAAHQVNTGTHEFNVNLSVPIAVADSGFDLNTDAWRANVPPNSICWCPNSTGIVSPGCGPGYGPNGTFFSYSRNFGGYFHVSRVRSSFDTLPGDGLNSAEAAFWGAPTNLPGFGVTGSNFVGYAHGTQVAAIAAGHRYSDQFGDQWAGCLLCPPGFDCVPPIGQQLCPVLGMDGVAPEAYLHLIKVALDADQSLSPFSAQISGVQQALAVGAWIFNLSYESDPYPLSLVSESLDRAAYDPAVNLGLVIVGSAGNRGGDLFPDEVRKGYFNGLIVAATGANAPFNDLVSPGSSHGPRAWPDPSGPNDVVSGQDGVNISAPGGNWDAQGNVFDGLRTPYPDETYSQANYFSSWFGGVWGSRPVAGTSAASPIVAGVAALVLGEDLTNNNGRTLNQRDVRAILLNQADDISGCNPGETASGYGQGRVNALTSVDFFNLGGILKRGTVAPATSQRKRKVTLTAGQPTEITLVWDRVTYPVIAGDTGVSNLQLEVYQGDYPPGCSGMPCQPVMVPPIASSRHPENNFERVTFTPSVTGTHTIRVVVPSGGFVLSDGSDGNPAGTTPDVPFTIAAIQGSPGMCRQ